MCYDPRHHPDSRRFLTRRDMLRQTSTGFGMLALSALMADSSYAGLSQATGEGPLVAKIPPLLPLIRPAGLNTRLTRLYQ